MPAHSCGTSRIRHQGLLALAAVCLLSVAAWHCVFLRSGPSVLLQRGNEEAHRAAEAIAADQLDAGARDLMEANVAAARQLERAADEHSAEDVWSPPSRKALVLGPRATRNLGERRAVRRVKDQRRAARRRSRRAQQISPAAKEEYLRSAPENMSWSPYHIVPAHTGSKAHREGKFSILGKVAPGQSLWVPEWKPEPTGGGGFTLRMYGLNSDCVRGAGANIICPRRWIPHDYLTDWDDHGENDRGGLHSFEGSAVTPDVTATSMSWFDGHIKSSPRSFLAVWWGQLPIVKFDDYEFCASSARDGIRLFLNGKLLIDNDGRGSRSERCASINLDPGNHHIRVDGFQVSGGHGGGGTSKIVKYRGEDTGGSKVNLKSNDCCTPGYVLPTPEGYSGIGYDEKAINNNGALGEHNMDEGGTYVPPEKVEDAEKGGGAKGVGAGKGAGGDEKWSIEVYVFYPWTKPLTKIPNVGDIEPQSYLGDWKEGGPYFSCELASLPITWGAIDGEAAGYSMLPKVGPVAVVIGGHFEIEIEGEYEFCGESMMGGRLFVSSMKVMECDAPGPCQGCEKWHLAEGEHAVKAYVYSSPAPAPLKFDLKYSGPDTKHAKKTVKSMDSKVRPALQRGGFRLYVFMTHPGSPAGMGWADPALKQVCTPNPPGTTPLKHPDILAPPLFCEFMFVADTTKNPVTPPPVYCCYTPPWMEKQKPIMEAVIPEINFNGLKDWMDYNPLQTPVMFGFVIYGAGLAESAGSQTICIKTMGGSRAWAGVDTWKKPKDPTVNNDGLKLAPKEECGDVSTGKGLFPIKVDGFFNMGNPLLVVTHNGKLMHSFDNGIPHNTVVSVRSNKVYTLRMAQKVMNRTQKNSYKSAMLHQQLLEKRTIRLAAKRIKEKTNQHKRQQDRQKQAEQKLRKAELYARHVRLQLEHGEHKATSTVDAVMWGDHLSPSATPPDHPTGHGGLLDIVNDHSTTGASAQTTQHASRSIDGANGYSFAPESAPPAKQQQMARMHGRANARESERESAGSKRREADERMSSIQADESRSSLHEHGPSGHGGERDVVEGVGDNAAFEGNLVGQPRWVMNTPRTRTTQPKWEKGWGFGLKDSKVHDENAAALRGFNEIEEEEIYAEPTDYMNTEMAMVVTEADSTGNLSSAKPTAIKGKRIGGRRYASARRLLQADEAEHVDSQTSFTSSARLDRRHGFDSGLEQQAADSVWSPPSPAPRGSGRRAVKGRRKGVMERLHSLRQQWHTGGSAQGHSSLAWRGRAAPRQVERPREPGQRKEAAHTDGWNIMARDLATKESGHWSVTGDRVRRSGDALPRGHQTLEIVDERQALKVMDHKDAATSHKSGKGNGRPEQRVYRGPNSEIAHAPTHERIGRGWYGPDQKYNFPGHWRYYKDTPAKMAPEVDQHKLIDKKNGPFPGHIPFWWTPNKFDARGPNHHKRAHHHTIKKDWYGRDTYDDKGNPLLPPSFYYDGVKEGEWHDGWEDFRRDFNEDAVPWNHNDPEFGQKPQVVQGWDGPGYGNAPWGKEKGTGEHSYGHRWYGKDDEGWQEPFHEEDVGIDDEGWARIHKDITVRYESDFSPPFNNRNGENADVSRIINGYNTGRWWPLWGKIIPYGDPLMVHHDLPVKRDWLPPGAFLASENHLLNKLWSKESEYELVMQGDGNLVLYHQQHAPGGQSAPGVGVWATGTVNKGSPPYRAYMDPKGAFQIIDSSKGVLWSTGTTDSHGTGRSRLMWSAASDGDLSGAIVAHTLRLHQDGSLLIHDRYGKEVWKGGIYNSIQPLYC